MHLINPFIHHQHTLANTLVNTLYCPPVSPSLLPPCCSSDGCDIRSCGWFTRGCDVEVCGFDYEDLGGSGGHHTVDRARVTHPLDLPLTAHPLNLSACTSHPSQYNYRTSHPLNLSIYLPPDPNTQTHVFERTVGRHRLHRRTVHHHRHRQLHPRHHPLHAPPTP